MSEEEMLETAIRFTANMGLIDSPGGGEWHSRMMGCGGPKQYRRLLVDSLRDALKGVGGDACCSLADLQELRKAWSWREG